MDIKTTKNTLSVGTLIDNKHISEAKEYLKVHFDNKFDATPHFNFSIIAMPQHKLKDSVMALDNYFKNKKSIKLTFGELMYEEEEKFFSIPILGDDLLKIHSELIQLLNPIRGGYIRERDFMRINKGKVNNEDIDNIVNFGYLRVFNKFSPHITIGNIRKDTFDFKEVKKTLDTLLSDFYNSSILISEVYANFIEEAEVQSDYKFLWEKRYFLS